MMSFRAVWRHVRKGKTGGLSWGYGCSSMESEPIVKEADSKADGPGLRADLGIRGVWTPKVEALFDIKVIDTDAQLHLHRRPEQILGTGALEKKKLYKNAVEDRRR